MGKDKIMDRLDEDRAACQHCESPHVGKVLVKGKPLCGTCALIIWLTGRDPA